MKISLLLANGGHRGIEAPLELGYYMIGRHRECQIRPHSHSVSRRHCLLHRDANHLRIFDLGSTNRTTVNETPLDANEWRELQDGDQVRCGKVLFQVTMAAETSAPASDQKTGSQDGHEHDIVRGEPWTDFDLVEFLEREDDAERELRYKRLRAEDMKAHDDDNIHVLDEIQQHVNDPSVSGLHGATSVDLMEGSSSHAPALTRSERISQIRARIAEERARQAKTQKKRPFHVVRSNPQPDVGASGNWQVVLTLTLASIACAALLYSGFEFFQGPDPNVISGID